MCRRSVWLFFFFLMIRRPPRSTLSSSSAASDVYKRQSQDRLCPCSSAPRDHLFVLALQRQQLPHFVGLGVVQCLDRVGVQGSVLCAELFLSLIHISEPTRPY
eukprot:TRINITY_DN5785_c0_g1_i3.p1 TRINITY_DN5785_c0_g1~~TRINITY_DN5785_c0_g1_i3.p1  ORF type:complete len:103 (-),score=19.28 TRINITY_DN5785_c0_g1_i3:72-380(-)